MQSIEIFLQSSVNGLSEPEDVLHDSVGVFHLAAHSGFTMLNVSLPVNGVARNPGQPARSAIDAEFDCGKAGIMFDFIPFLKPQISAVPVDNLVILPQQFFRHCDFVDIGGGGLHCMDKTAARIHADMALHAELPLVSLFRLVHFGVSFLFRILGRARCA